MFICKFQSQDFWSDFGKFWDSFGVPNHRIKGKNKDDQAMLYPTKSLFQLAGRKLDHSRATMGAGPRGFARFQLAH